MNKKLIKRVPAVVLTVAILFTTVFALSISASALTFTPRYSMPSTDNEYYYSSMNPFYPAGYGLPNCTAYAYGRVYEITGKKPNLSTGNAENWYGYNMSTGAYDYGQTPRLGAIACWSYNGGGGHVAVVEYIDTSTGEMILSNSAWSARYGSCEPFYLTYANVNDSNPGGSSWWNFQGYIYAVDSPDVVVNTGSGKKDEGGNSPVVIGGDDDADAPDTGKTFNKGVYQVNVDDFLTMRTGAGTRYSFVTKVPDGAKLKVTAVKKTDDLTWGETSYDGWDGWIALNYCKYTGSLDTWTDDDVVVPTEEPTEAPTQKPTQKPTQPATTIPEVPTEAPTTVPATTVAPTTAAPATQKATEPNYSKGIGTGDINADGTIDIVDATMIQKAAAGMGNFSSQQLKWCDFDFDGSVTISDATLVQKIAIGIYNYYL